MGKICQKNNSEPHTKEIKNEGAGKEGIKLSGRLRRIKLNAYR